MAAVFPLGKRNPRFQPPLRDQLAESDDWPREQCPPSKPDDHPR